MNLINVLKRYKNWLTYKLKMRNFIYSLRFTVTWKCNSKCITCSIWKDKDTGRKDLTLEEIDKFSKSKYFRKTEYITISGGEPTLRNDFPDIITVLHKNIPTARFSMTTHGMNPEIEEEYFRKILKDNPGIKFDLVGISMNGPSEIHDLTRGIKGSWEKTVETYNRIKNLVHCEFSFTFCKQNVDYFDWVQEFSKQNGTRSYICWTVMNDRFETSDDDLVFWKPGMEKILNKYLQKMFPFSDSPGVSIKIKNLLFLPINLVFGYLYESAINRRVMPCFAGVQIVHIDPEGNVYPCNFKLSDDRIVGNLRERKFDEIWESISENILKEISEGKCMYPNGLCGDSDIFPSIYNSPHVIFNWYLKKILKKSRLIEVLENK